MNTIARHAHARELIARVKRHIDNYYAASDPDSSARDDYWWMRDDLDEALELLAGDEILPASELTVMP